MAFQAVCFRVVSVDVPIILVIAIWRAFITESLDCEQSLFCSRIRGEQRKKMSEHDIQGRGGGWGRASRPCDKPANSAGSPNVVLTQFFAFFPADSPAKERLLAVPSQCLQIWEFIEDFRLRSCYYYYFIIIIIPSMVHVKIMCRCFDQLKRNRPQSRVSLIEVLNNRAQISIGGFHCRHVSGQNKRKFDSWVNRLSHDWVT